MKIMTRKLLAVLTACVMVCLLIPVGAVGAVSANPVVNSGFEDGKANWACNSGTAEIVSDAHSGNYALSLTNPSQYGEAAMQTIAVEANTDYVFTWYAKRIAGTGAFNLYLMNASGYANLERLAGQNWMNDKSNEWIKYEYTVNTGDATSVIIKFSSETKNAGTILIDDVSVAKVGGDEVDPSLNNIESLMANIKTQGRTALVNGTLMLDFSISGMEFELDCSGDVYATFNARKLASTSSTGGIYFTIVVDGVAQPRDYCRITSGGQTKFLLAEGLSAGKHTFGIYRQSEHQYGEIGVCGLSFDGTMLAKPADKDLYVEFIGDSISCGFGNLGNSSQGDGSALWSDGTQAYTYLTAQALDADWSNVSWSGLGCKYGYSSTTMQDVYPALRYNNDKNTAYDFSKRPDVIVLSLGTNDNSKAPNATAKREGLVEMLTLVREKNPDTPIVWIYNMMTNGVNAMIEEIVAEFGGAEAGYYACKLTQNTSGGGWHPNLKGQQKFADELVAFLQENGLDVPLADPDVPVDPVPGMGEYLLCETGTSRMEMTEETLGLAFRFSLGAPGVKLNSDYTIDLSAATVCATAEGVSSRLLAVGAVVTNDPEVGLVPSRMVRENVSGKTKDVDAVYGNNVLGDFLHYAVRVTNIPVEMSDAVIYARPYYVYDFNGTAVTVYGEICKANYNDNINVNDGIFEW